MAGVKSVGLASRRLLLGVEDRGALPPSPRLVPTVWTRSGRNGMSISTCSSEIPPDPLVPLEKSIVTIAVTTAVGGYMRGQGAPGSASDRSERQRDHE